MRVLSFIYSFCCNDLTRHIDFSCCYSFATVVLFLKVLLQQADLDKPFTGGLGSYKLYVLVANHVSLFLVFTSSRYQASSHPFCVQYLDCLPVVQHA